MEARRPRRHLLKPRSLAPEERPAPARLQMPTPGTSEAAVAMPPDFADAPYDPTSVPSAPPREEYFPGPAVGLTLIPSLAPRSDHEAIEALEADDESPSSSIQAVEAERSVPEDGESQREPDSFAMELEPREELMSFGVRLQRSVHRGLTASERLLLAAMLAMTPLVLGGGIFLGWSVARAFERPTAAVTAPVPEPVVLAPLPEPVEVPGAEEPASEEGSVSERTPPRPTPAPPVETPRDPWDQPPAAVQPPTPAPAPAEPPPTEEEERRRGKKKKPR